MSEESDDDKQLPPSAKKMADARDKGDVAIAGELRHAAMFGGSLILIGGLGHRAMEQMGGLAGNLWQNAGEWRVDAGFAAALGVSLWAMLAPLFALLMVTALVAGLAQGRPTIASTRLAPKWERLSPVAGLKRLFGPVGGIEFAKTLVKLLLVLTAALIAMRGEAPDPRQLVGVGPAVMAALTADRAETMLRAALIVAALLAAADFAWQHRRWIRRMMMTPQEMKQEMKEEDGDPHIKGKRRQIQMAMARQRMMAAVPEATVIVTNPTHYAVALRYDHGAMAVPVLVAKGVDSLALRIREVAGEHKVPIVESPPLARALYAQGEVGAPIDPAHYAAVAEIISTVLRLAGRLDPAAGEA